MKAHTLLRPMITEKTMAQAATGWYTFAVRKFARKEQIAKEINDSYKVQVTDINTVSRTGKVRRAGRKMQMTKRSDWKKAVVRLAKGQRIPVFEVPEEQTKK